MLDTKALAEATAAIVKQHVEAATAPLLARIAALEEAKADTPDFVAMVAGEVSKLHIPAAPEPIAPDMDAIGELVERAVSERVKAIPAPKDGTSITLDDVRPLIEEGVAKAVAEIPVPTNGEPGKDGAGIADLVIDRTGGLVATFTDGRMKELGQVVGKDGQDGEPGKDGQHGMGPEDIGLTLMEDGRTLRFSFDKGDTEYAFQIPFPVMIYRGVWQDGQAYEEGDTVTWGGSLWHANKGTAGKPDGGDWTLCAKKGRDGKDAK
jgi:integrin beta 3